MTIVLGAMDGEIAEFVDRLTDRREERWQEYRFHLGRMAGEEVVVARSGVGKSLSAMICQVLIDRYAGKRVLFTGLAGAVNPTLEIGDTVIARDCIQYDMDATALGFDRGEIPYSPYRFLACDEALVTRAASFRPASGKLVLGRVLTGDRFMVRSAMKDHAYLTDDLAGDVVEMEGASVGLVARVNTVPFLIARTVSDKADTDARVDFERFLPVASRNSAELVEHLLSEGG